MAWWIVVLLPVPVVAVLGLVAVIATAFSISAEEDRRRLRLQRLSHRAPEVPALGIVPSSREDIRATPASVSDAIERVSTLP